MAKTIDELREQYPELVAQIENAAMENGKKEERNRIKGIEEIADGIMDKELVMNAKFGENPITAAELSLEEMKRQASIGATTLAYLQDDTKASGAAQVKADPKSAEEDEEEKKKEEEEKEVDALANIANAARGGK